MSYRRVYHGVITGSATERVSYPASQNGGSTTVRVNYSEPFVVNIDVDTDPVDSGIAACKYQLTELEGSIHISSKNQVLEKAESTRRVVKAALDGFGSLIFSEIDQQLVEIAARIHAATALLLEENKEAEKREAQSTKDFQRIKERYASLFHTLNKDLDRRIRALDEAAFKLVRSDFRERISEPMMAIPASTAVYASETAPAIERTGTSFTKRHVLDLLAGIRRYLGSHAKTRTEMSSMLSSEAATEAADICLPALMVESDDLNNLKLDILTCKDIASPAMDIERLRKFFLDRSWVEPPASLSELVHRRFMELLGESFDLSDPVKKRTADLTVKLMRQNSWLSAV